MVEAIRVAVIDDHPIFLVGLEKVLRRMKQLSLVASGGSAADAQRIADKDRPDLILLDLTMPGGGIEAARTITAAFPSIKIIVLSASNDDEHVAAALESGARGYLVKGASAAELLQAIQSVHAGEPYITPLIAARYMMQKVRRLNNGGGAPAQDPKLNHREQEILELVMEGMTNQQIAGHLKLSPTTIKNYMSHIFEKLQVHSRTQAMAAWRRK
jgi:two-component system, NarL family, nitrate/nitrite response regulator NarL